MRDLQPDITEQLIETAMAAGLVSAPHFPQLPVSLPMHVAIRAIALPEGCAPPAGGLGRRIASGTGPSRDIAAWVAGMEALERYSLQFTPARAGPIAPFARLGGSAEPLDGATLMLGAPQPHVPATTRGCAAGLTLADATARAALETLEHFHIGRARAGDPLHPLPLEGLLPDDLAEFLSSQLRRLVLSAHVSPLGYAVVHAALSDFDGGRITTGSGAATDPAEAARKAWQEALLSWRNMIEMERNAVAVTALAGDEAAAFRLYRGADTPPDWHLPAGRPQIPAAGISSDMLAILADVCRMRVRAFDLTHAEIGLPVVRIVTG